MKTIRITSGVKKNDRYNGSVLLITLLMMGVILTLTLGISVLVIREIRVTRTIIDSNKAYYAAEAGVENAMLQLAMNTRGYELDDGCVEYPGQGTQTPDPFRFKYCIKNTTSTYPDFPDDKPIFVRNCQIVDSLAPGAVAMTRESLFVLCPQATYKRLPLNDTQIIPLYSGNTDVQDFLLQYYVNFTSDDLADSVKGVAIANLDILRWKLYGEPKDADLSQPQKTDSIADLFPGYDGNSAERPLCIGTDSNLRAASESCLLPVLAVDKNSAPIGGQTEGEEVVTADDTLSNLWSAARECYLSDAGYFVSGGEEIRTATTDDPLGCSMRTFLEHHKNNYLVLSNLVNPDIIGITNLNNQAGLRKADIYYRVIAGTGSGLVRDAASIAASGYAMDGQVVKSLNVDYKTPGFLPVFNFSLYGTKSSQ